MGMRTTGVIVLVSLLCSSANAAYWTDDGPDSDVLTADNWDIHMVPGFGIGAVVDGGGYAEITNDFPVSASSAINFGVGEQANGLLPPALGGDGTVNHISGQARYENLFLGGAGGNGIYEMTGGAVAVSNSTYVGGYAGGANSNTSLILNGSDAVFDTPQLLVQSDATVEVRDGTLQATPFLPWQLNQGTIQQTGGRIQHDGLQFQSGGGLIDLQGGDYFAPNGFDFNPGNSVVDIHGGTLLLDNNDFGGSVDFNTLVNMDGGEGTWRSYGRPATADNLLFLERGGWTEVSAVLGEVTTVADTDGTLDDVQSIIGFSPKHPNIGVRFYDGASPLTHDPQVDVRYPNLLRVLSESLAGYLLSKQFHHDVAATYVSDPDAYSATAFSALADSLTGLDLEGSVSPSAIWIHPYIPFEFKDDFTGFEILLNPVVMTELYSDVGVIDETIYETLLYEGYASFFSYSEMIESYLRLGAFGSYPEWDSSFRQIDTTGFGEFTRAEFFYVVPPVPEPSTIGLTLIGVAMCAVRRKKTNR